MRTVRSGGDFPINQHSGKTTARIILITSDYHSCQDISGFRSELAAVRSPIGQHVSRDENAALLLVTGVLHVVRSLAGRIR